MDLDRLKQVLIQIANFNISYLNKSKNYMNTYVFQGHNYVLYPCGDTAITTKCKIEIVSIVYFIPCKEFDFSIRE